MPDMWKPLLKTQQEQRLLLQGMQAVNEEGKGMSVSETVCGVEDEVVALDTEVICSREFRLLPHSSQVIYMHLCCTAGYNGHLTRSDVDEVAERLGFLSTDGERMRFKARLDDLVKAGFIDRSRDGKVFYIFGWLGKSRPIRGNGNPEPKQRSIKRKQLCTVQELSELTSVSEQTIRRYIREGEIPSIRIGHRLLINMDDFLNQDLKEQR